MITEPKSTVWKWYYLNDTDNVLQNIPSTTQTVSIHNYQATKSVIIKD